MDEVLADLISNTTFAFLYFVFAGIFSVEFLAWLLKKLEDALDNKEI